MGEKIRWLYNVLQLLVVFISLIYGIIYWKKIKQHGYLKLFPIYIAVSMATTLAWFFEKIHFPGVLIQNITVPFEFLVFYNLFFKVLKDKKFYFILIALSVLYCLSIIIVATFLYSNQNKHMNIISFLSDYNLSELMLIESILVVIPILFYYISLFNRPYIKNLTANPIFLAMTGILFCMVLTIPILAFQKIILNHNRQLYLYLYMINSIAYIIMNLFFIKAFKSIK